jgi:translation initiation factor IF-3
MEDSREVRVIGPKGEDLGIMPREAAEQLAEEMGFDLIEVSPRTNPPLCRIMDYARFKFENARKNKKARRLSRRHTFKEVRLRPGTDARDIQLKVDTARRFLAESQRVKVTVTFRGREASHPETGRSVLQRVAKMLADVGAVEEQPTLDGRRLAMILVPR